MPEETNGVTGKSGKKKSGKRFVRDAGFFAGGFVCGAAGTLVLGVVTNNIDPHNLSLHGNAKPTPAK